MMKTEREPLDAMTSADEVARRFEEMTGSPRRWLIPMAN